MKIPLDHEPFPPVALSHDQELQLKWLADAILDEPLAENDDFVFTQKRTLDSSKWKHVMSRENVSIYKRVGKGELGGCTPDMSLYEPGIHPRTMYWRVPGCVGVGTLPGSLDDLLYGLLAPTKTSTKTRTTYIKDGVADSRVLANIIDPTEADPLRCLVVRWSLVYQLIHRIAVTPRDVLSMESIGSRMLPNGERVGYIVLQTVDVPGCPELSHLGLIRAKYSSCFVFRDTGNGSVELFMRGFVEAGGKLSDNLAVFSTATTLISTWRLMDASQSKKLAFMARKSLENKSRRDLFAKAKEDGSKSCPICSKSFSALRSTRCDLCRLKICSRCAEKRKLTHALPTGELARVMTVVCKGCLTTATRMNARDVAASEYVETTNRAVQGEIQQSLSDPPSLLAWLNQDVRQQSDTISSYSTIGQVDSEIAEVGAASITVLVFRPGHRSHTHQCSLRVSRRREEHCAGMKIQCIWSKRTTASVHNGSSQAAADL